MGGYKSLNIDSPKKWPVNHIWFNDKANLSAALGLSTTSKGWMDKLIDSPDADESLRKLYKSVTTVKIPLVNDDGVAGSGGGKLILAPLTGTLSFSNIAEVLGPSGAALQAGLGYL